MREITVISGKGGTGKTSLVAAFASLAENSVLADCDVDAADLHLILEPTIIEQQDFKSGFEVAFDPSWCSGCGECVPVCRFNAVRLEPVEDRPEWILPRFDELACEGCGACVDVCPTEAIRLIDKVAGDLYVSKTRFGPLVHARLGIAESSSGKLVSAVRKRAKEIASEHGHDIILVDGPPGIGCPVIASLGAVDAALIVTEPSVSGVHDFERVAGVCGHFGISTHAVVNKWDLNPDMTERIESLCAEQEIGFLGKLPFEPDFVRAMVEKKSIVEYNNALEINREIERIWRVLSSE